MKVTSEKGKVKPTIPSLVSIVCWCDDAIIAWTTAISLLSEQFSSVLLLEELAKKDFPTGYSDDLEDLLLVVIGAHYHSLSLLCHSPNVTRNCPQ